MEQPVSAVEASAHGGPTGSWRFILCSASLLLTVPGLLLNIGADVCHYFGPHVWLLLTEDDIAWSYVAGSLRVIIPFFGGLLGLGCRSTLAGKLAMAVAAVNYAVFFAFLW